MREKYEQEKKVRRKKWRKIKTVREKKRKMKIKMNFDKINK